MRGAVFLGNRRIEIRDFPDPTPGRGEVVIEMKASGMCGSDLKFYRSPPGAAQAALGLGNQAEPFIAGHEPCGVVAARGRGVCRHCRVGWSQLCRAGIVVYGVTAHGGHAEYLKVPARTLVPLPDELSFVEGAAVACGTGTAYGALRRMHLAGGSTLAVFGQGPVGLSATLLGAKMGARVIAVETNPERLALAKQFGADAAVHANDSETALKDLTRGEGVDLALDCTGIAAARLAAVRSAKTWGTVCFVGEGGEVTLDVSRDMLRKQLTLIGSWTFSAMGQAECARFIADNDIDLEKIFSHRWKLGEVEEAYRVFDTQATGKGVIVF